MVIGGPIDKEGCIPHLQEHTKLLEKVGGSFPFFLPTLGGKGPSQPMDVVHCCGAPSPKCLQLGG